MGDNRLETTAGGQEKPFPGRLRAVTLQLGYFYVLFYSSFQFHFIYLEEIEGSLPKEGSVRTRALKWRKTVTTAAQPSEGGPRAVHQPKSCRGWLHPRPGLGRCRWQVGGMGQPLPCSRCTPEACTWVLGRSGWKEESARGSLSGWQRAVPVGPRGPGEGAATTAQQRQGAGRRCWAQHQGMEATLLCLLSQRTWDQPCSGQLVGAVWQKRNLLHPQ